jgi:hypothetical protein
VLSIRQPFDKPYSATQPPSDAHPQVGLLVADPGMVINPSSRALPIHQTNKRALPLPMLPSKKEAFRHHQEEHHCIRGQKKVSSLNCKDSKNVLVWGVQAQAGSLAAALFKPIRSRGCLQIMFCQRSQMAVIIGS